MNDFVAALVPILGLIVIGYALMRVRLLSQEAWAGLERLTYYLLFPALLLRSLAGQDPGQVDWAQLLLLSFATLMVASMASLFVIRRNPAWSGALRTSVFQGSVRFNTFIVLALAQGLFGEAGLALASLVCGLLVVQVNLLSLLAFGHWGRSGGLGLILRQVLLNPLILACMAGLALSALDVGLPASLDQVLGLLGRAALPLGLLAVGAALRLDDVRRVLRPAGYACLVQFGVKPLTILMLGSLMGLASVPLAVMLIAFSSPTAPSAYVLSRQLGGDSQAMAAIITSQTMLAFVLMPLWALCL